MTQHLLTIGDALVGLILLPILDLTDGIAKCAGRGLTAY